MKEESQSRSERSLADEIEAQFMAHQPPASYPSEWVFNVKMDFRDWHAVVKALRAIRSKSTPESRSERARFLEALSAVHVSADSIPIFIGGYAFKGFTVGDLRAALSDRGTSPTSVVYLIDGRAHRQCECDQMSSICPRGAKRASETCGYERCLVPVPGISVIVPNERPDSTKEPK